MAEIQAVLEKKQRIGGDENSLDGIPGDDRGTDYKGDTLPIQVGDICRIIENGTLYYYQYVDYSGATDDDIYIRPVTNPDSSKAWKLIDGISVSSFTKESTFKEDVTFEKSVTISGGLNADILPKSVLTTQGDLIVRGEESPERLGIGSAGQIPQVNDDATGLEYVNKPDIDFSNLLIISPVINIPANTEVTVYSSSDITVNAGDMFDIYMHLFLQPASTAVTVQLNLRYDVNNTVEIMSNGGTFSSSFWDFMYVPNSITQVFDTYRFRVKALSGGVFDFKLGIKSVGSTTTVQSGYSKIWYNKIN